MTLHLTHIATDQAARQFDDRAWRWLLRDSGELARMTPAEVKLVLLIYCLADRHGRCDVPTSWCAEQLGLTPRAVREARKRLEDRRVLQVLTDETRARRGAKSVVLLMPPAPGVEGDAPVLDEVREPSGGAPLPGGKLRSVGGEARFPQRGICKEKNKNSGGNARPPDGASDAPLYEKSAYDRAAAAALVERLGFAPRVAHGLVSQYRPTERQVLNILANIEARDAEARQDASVRPIGNRVAFVTSAIKRCDYALDERVLDRQRRRQQQEQAGEARARREQHETRQREAERAQRDESDRLWDSLTGEQRTALRRRAELKLPDTARRIHARYGDDSPAVRALILAEAREVASVKCEVRSTIGDHRSAILNPNP